MKKLGLLTTFIFLAITSCQEKKDIESDRQALVKLTAENWDKNSLNDNPEANLEAYTDDAIRIYDGKQLSGKEAIRAAFNQYAEQYTVLRLEDKVEDIWISGDLAGVRGSYIESFIRKEAGDTINNKGAWVDVCKRQANGSWKMVLTLVTKLEY